MSAIRMTRSSTLQSSYLVGKTLGGLEDLGRFCKFDCEVALPVVVAAVCAEGMIVS